MKRRSNAGVVLLVGTAAGLVWLMSCAANVVPTETSPKGELAGPSAVSSTGGVGSTGSSTTSSTATTGAGGSAPGCSNGVKDGEETDVDCGTPECGRCPFGKHCGNDINCLDPGQCLNSVCTPNLVGIWTQVASGGPSGRVNAGMVYDRLHKQTLLVGGDYQNPATSVADMMWTWDGTSWAELAPPGGPTPRGEAVMVYDSHHDRTFYYGGALQANGPAATYGDSYEWDGNVWTTVAPMPPLGLSSEAAFAFDTEHNVIVLEGGALSPSSYLWDGANNVAAPILVADPGNRFSASMTYDEANKQVVLFGGDVGGSAVADTWLWDGTMWTSPAPSNSPPLRYGAAMVYDSARRRAVLFGGLSAVYYQDTWEWDGQTWVQILTDPMSTPSGRYAPAMAFDSDRRRVVLFGGQTVAPAWEDDTWEYYAIANPCVNDKDCDTNHCVDGLCCAESSCGSCQACNTQDSPGHCAPVTGKDSSCAGTCSDAGMCMQ